MSFLFHWAIGGLNKDEPPAPPPRTVLQEGMETLDAYQQLFPKQFEIESEAAHRYAGLSQSIVDRYASPLTESIRDLSLPRESAATLAELNRQAAEEVAAGSRLTPAMQREIQQYVRGGQAARGMGFGPSDLNEEVFTLGSAGEALKANRRNFAQSVLGFEQQRGQIAAGAALQSVFGQVPTPPQATPFTPYAADVFNTNFNAQWTDKLATRNYNAAMNAALMGMIGNIIGGAGGAAGAAGCWVAREVFGEDSVLWRLFRAWLLDDAPAWLRWAYGRYGKRVAAWLPDKPRLKAVVRHWMLRRIADYLVQRPRVQESKVRRELRELIRELVKLASLARGLTRP